MVKKTPRDPNAPKRNTSAYLLYQNAKRDEFKAKNPDMTFGQLAKYTSSMYAEMPQSEKEHWQQKAEQDKSRYLDELSRYVPPPGYDSKGDAIVSNDSPKSSPSASTKRGKAVRIDPNKPKRNMSAYLHFQNAMRATFKNENPGMTFGQLAKYTSQKFKNLTDEERAIWEGKAAEDKRRYETQIRAYVAPKNKVVGGDSKVGVPKRRGRKKGSKKDPNAPKRATGAYVFFTKEMRPIISQQHPGIKFVDMGKLLGEKWRDLDPENKRKYEEMASQDKVRFRREKDEYQANGGGRHAHEDIDEDEQEEEEEAEEEIPQQVVPQVKAKEKKTKGARKEKKQRKEPDGNRELKQMRSSLPTQGRQQSQPSTSRDLQDMMLQQGGGHDFPSTRGKGGNNNDYHSMLGPNSGNRDLQSMLGSGGGSRDFQSMLGPNSGSRDLQSMLGQNSSGRDFQSMLLQGGGGDFQSMLHQGGSGSAGGGGTRISSGDRDFQPMSHRGGAGNDLLFQQGGGRDLQSMLRQDDSSDPQQLLRQLQPGQRQSGFPNQIDDQFSPYYQQQHQQRQQLEQQIQQLQQQQQYQQRHQSGAGQSFPVHQNMSQQSQFDMQNGFQHGLFNQFHF
mmetsp:Transcript_1332/g.2605  ORF Transcript_1332/g.2605 Transcript_1332/m.2605 type:complete len:614 (-) Transcript_1332:230-2071(-)